MACWPKSWYGTGFRITCSGARESRRESLARLYRCFRQEKARIVHTHQFTQLLFSLLPAKVYGAKIVHTEHEFYVYRDDARARRLFKQLLRFCSALTVVGPEVARYYIEELGVAPERIHVIANGVDLDQFNFAGRESRSRLGLSTDDVVSVLWAASNLKRTIGPVASFPRAHRSLSGSAFAHYWGWKSSQRIGVLFSNSRPGAERDVPWRAHRHPRSAGGSRRVCAVLGSRGRPAFRNRSHGCRQTGHRNRGRWTAVAG